MEANNKSPLCNKKHRKKALKYLTVTLYTGTVAFVIILVKFANDVQYSPPSSESAKGIQSPIHPITPTQGKLCYIISRISANSFRGNYSFLDLALCTMTFGDST